MLYYPNHLNIETSDYCNRRCSYCPVQRDRDDHPPRLLDLDVYTRLLDELARAPWPLKISLQWIDEPLANPSFDTYAKLAKERVPDATWLLQTNGDFLGLEHLPLLRESFDAVVVNLYAASALQRVEKLELPLREARGAHRIQSPGRLEPARGDEAGEGALFHLNHKFHDDDWVQHHEEVQMPPEEACTKLWVQAAIAYNGDVHICCRDNLKAHPVGNLGEMSLLEAYNSDEAMRLRRAMEAGRRDRIAMCHTCPSAYKNRFDVLAPAHIAALRPWVQGEIEPDAPAALRRRPAPPRPLPLVDDREPSPPVARPWAEQMPWGRFDYWSARDIARDLGHVCAPGFLARRYEYVAGLSSGLWADLEELLRAELRDGLIGVLVCGGRVMTRTHLQKVDPSVFEGPSPLTVGRKPRLREMGNDPRLSSDLDLKVFVDACLVSEDDADRLAPHLGRAAEAMSPFVPLSGHRRPLLRVLRVPSSCTDARTAFAHYNARRTDTMNKGPLSLQYTQVLFDRSREVTLGPAARDDVVARLVPRREGARRVPVSTLAGEGALLDLDEGARLRAEHGGLTGHQLIGALLDFPTLEPGGLFVDDAGHVVAGALGAWAAARAGRHDVQVQAGIAVPASLRPAEVSS